MINIENLIEILTLILSILASLWTIYQEIRHKKDNGTIRPIRKNMSVENLKERLTIAQDHLERFEMDLHAMIRGK